MKLRRTAWLGLMLLGCALANTASAADAAETVTVVFRHDNYSSLSPKEFDAGLLNLFAEYDVPATFSVIPFVSSTYAEQPGPQRLVPLTHEKAATLKKAMGKTRIEVALHGYSHQIVREDEHYEFAGMPYVEQRERIRKGKEHLERLLGVKITTFAPPGDSYDENTVRAAEAEGFTTFSPSLKGMAVPSANLRFVPGTAPVDKIREAVTAARESGEKEPVVVALIHSFEFFEIDLALGMVTLDEFKNLLGWLKTQDNLRLANISEVASARPDLNAALFKERNVGSRLRIRLTPQALGDMFTYYFLYPSSTVTAMTRARAWAALALIYLGALLLSAGAAFLVSRVLSENLPALWALGRYGGIAVLCALAYYMLRDCEIYFRGAIVLAVGLGLLAGMWLDLMARRRRGRTSTA